MSKSTNSIEKNKNKCQLCQSATITLCLRTNRRGSSREDNSYLMFRNKQESLHFTIDVETINRKKIQIIFKANTAE